MRNSETSECSGRRIVCIICFPRNINVLVVIRSCGMGACSLQYGAAQTCIGACIGYYYGFHCRKITVFIAGSRKIHFHCMSFRMNKYAFCPCKFYFYRTIGFLCQKGGMMLHAHIFFAAEPSSYHSGRYTDFIKRKSEGIGTLSLGLINTLVAAYYMYSAVFGKCNGTFRFHESMLRKRNAVMVCYFMFTL